MDASTTGGPGADAPSGDGHVPDAVTSGDPAAAVEAVTLARALGVVDALLFRRVSPTTWAHLGGLGRGRGWAGIIEVDEAADPLAARIPTRIGEIRRARFPEPARLLGPYYATAGAVIRTSNDVAVVLGNPRGPLADADDNEFRRLAGLLDAAIDDVLPSKRLADEIEVLQTVRALMASPTDAGLPETLRHVVSVATQALTCEIGVLRDNAGRLAVVTDDRALPDEAWHAVLDEVVERMDGSDWCEQDVASIPPMQLTALLPGTRSLLALAMPEPVGGVLLLVHTDRGPRGFTNQCRRLGRHVVDTGSVVARTATLRDELRAAADRASLAARTDRLTGLGNRLAWDEAVAAAQERVDHGATVSVLTLDLDGLKQINDEHGHAAGDDLLRRCAAVIRGHCGPDDVGVRLGGDEFAILFHDDSVSAESRYSALASELGAPHSSADTVAASVGVATAGPGGRLADAFRDADVQMYRHKRDRRRHQLYSDSGAR